MAKEPKTSPLSEAEDNLRKARQHYEKLVHSDKTKPEAKAQALVEKQAAVMALQAVKTNRPAKTAKTTDQAVEK